MSSLRNGRNFFGKLPKCSHINIVDLPEWVLVSLCRFLLLLVAPADLVESKGFTLCASNVDEKVIQNRHEYVLFQHNARRFL